MISGWKNATDPRAQFGLDAIGPALDADRVPYLPLPARTRPGRINEHQPVYALGKPADGLSRGERLAT